MEIRMKINGKEIRGKVTPETLLIDFVRSKGCLSVKRGCETSNCGLCTVLLNEKPVLSCSTLALRADGKEVKTLEGIQEEALVIGGYIADEGAEQCGFCSPGFIMNVYAMKRELKNPTEEEMKEYLSGNLCRCTGYMGHLRALDKYFQEGEEKHHEDGK